MGQWLYNKFDKVSGVSFLPYSDHTYQQAPYEPVDKKVYRQLAKDFPKEISWDIEEASDMTEGSQPLAHLKKLIVPVVAGHGRLVLTPLILIYLPQF